MGYYPDIMSHKAVLCKHVTLLHYTHAGVKLVIKISSLILKESTNYQEKGRHDRSAN